MDAAGKSRGLDFSAFDFDAKPVRVRSVENDAVDGSLIQTFDPSQYAPVELVPDLSACTAGSAIPVAGSAPRPAATNRGGGVLPAEAPPIANATPLPPQTTTARPPFPRGAERVPVHHAAGLSVCAGPGAPPPSPIRVLLTTPA